MRASGRQGSRSTSHFGASLGSSRGGRGARSLPLSCSSSAAPCATGSSEQHPRWPWWCPRTATRPVRVVCTCRPSHGKSTTSSRPPYNVSRRQSDGQTADDPISRDAYNELQERVSALRAEITEDLLSRRRVFLTR